MNEWINIWIYNLVSFLHPTRSIGVLGQNLRICGYHIVLNKNKKVKGTVDVISCETELEMDCLVHNGTLKLNLKWIAWFTLVHWNHFLIFLVGVQTSNLNSKPTVKNIKLQSTING